MPAGRVVVVVAGCVGSVVGPWPPEEPPPQWTTAPRATTPQRSRIEVLAFMRTSSPDDESGAGARASQVPVDVFLAAGAQRRAGLVEATLVCLDREGSVLEEVI